MNQYFDLSNTENTDNVSNLCLLSNVNEKNNSSSSSSQSLLPIDEIVNKYYGLYDIEVLPHSNGSASLIPKGLLPWESAYGHKYILLIQELGIRMVLEAHTSLRGAMKRSNEVNVLNYLLNFSPFKFQMAGNHSKLVITLWFVRITTKIT